MQKQSPPATLSLKCILLAALYITSGELGLLLAVPPGYATIIWPASGIAIGMLLMHGPRLWPGILAGSFLLNCHVSGALTPDGIDAAKAWTAAAIAGGSTLQALAGYTLVARLIGLPLAFRTIRDAAGLFLIAGPFACLVAATCGVASLYLAGILPGSAVAQNWLTWWAGDTFGVLVFLPLVLLAPGGGAEMTWRGERIGSLPLLAMVVLLVPLGLTFYAWKITSENHYSESSARFATLAQESEKALRHRIDAYNYALLGGVGFFQGSEYVSPDEWRQYTKSIDVERNFPGINGIGFIEPIAPDKVAALTQRMHDEGDPGFAVHPETQGRPYYIIKYIEPKKLNEAAVGLNIGFEDNRQAAAELARDSGLPAITRRVILVQDVQKTPGFLLLHPMYQPGLPANTAAERRKAFLGWVYAPFIASHFLEQLTDSQGDTLHIRVYDGDRPLEENLIYSDERPEARSARKDAVFTVRKTITVMQTEWTIVWDSTPAFEARTHSDSPAFILAGGILFTGLFGLFLVLFTLRSADSLEFASDRRTLLFPTVVFAITMSGVCYLYGTLASSEDGYARAAAREAAKRVEKIVVLHTGDRINSLMRMARRWEVAGGMSEAAWRADAALHISDFSGITTLEWIGPDYRVRLVEPVKGNEKALGLDILFEKKRADVLTGAAEKRTVTITPPLDLVQGYSAIIAYAPIHIGEEFGGFMAGILSIDDFFGGIVDAEIPEGYRAIISHEGKAFFIHGSDDAELMPGLGATTTITLHDKVFTLRVVPTAALVRSLKTDIPSLILFFGTLVAALLALTVRYVLISRVKSSRLEESNKLNEGILAGASHFILVTDTRGNILVFNRKAEKMLGYTRAEIVGVKNPSIWHDDTEVEARAQELSQSERRAIIPGLKVFTLMAEKNGSETRDWTIIRKDGSTFPMRLTVTPLRDKKSAVTGYLGIGEDITEMHEMDRMKSEFVSIVSHELRTPLTSIRGALGLIEGAMASEIPEKVRSLVSIAHKNSERLILLINDILDLDKIAAGKMRFEPGPEDVAELVRTGIEINAGYAERHNVTFVTGNIPDGLLVNVDPDRWQQVFTNLLSNAAKFSPEGGEVRVDVARRSGFIRVSVSDSGPGVPAEFRNRIFSKFSQADSPLQRQKGGTGLGLNICKEIVTRMRGEIGFDSPPGKGATFWFEFRDISAGSAAHAHMTGNVPFILHIEDDGDLSRMLEAGMQDRARIITVSTLAEARAAVAVIDFDLILLDLALPDGSGLDFLDELEKMGRGTPVIILSSMETPQAHAGRVAEALVKSRDSEAEIIRIILSHLPERKEGKNAS